MTDAVVVAESIAKRYGETVAVADVSLAIPAAILTNVIRVAGTALLSDRDPELGTGFYHIFSGWLVFLAGLGILFAATKILKRLSQSR